MTAKPKKLTYSVPEAAEALGVSTQTCYEQINAGRLPSLRVGRRVLVPIAELEAWIGRQTGNGHSAPKVI